MNRHTLIIRIATTALVSLVAGHALADYEISRATIDAGGTMSSGGASYSLAASIGQPDAGPMASATYDLSGGFWFSEPPGDCDATGLVDLFDYEDLSGCLLGPDLNAGPAPCNCLDIDDDGDIDLFDFAEFQVLLET